MEGAASDGSEGVSKPESTCITELREWAEANTPKTKPYTISAWCDVHKKSHIIYRKEVKA